MYAFRNARIIHFETPVPTTRILTLIRQIIGVRNWF